MQSYSLNVSLFGYEVQFSETSFSSQGKQPFSLVKAGLCHACSRCHTCNICRSQKGAVKAGAIPIMLPSDS